MDGAIGQYFDSADENADVSAKLYPRSCIALVRHGEKYYFVQPGGHSYGEVVHELTVNELSRIHHHNLHVSQSIELTPEEIGGPPFEKVQVMLGEAKGMIACRDLVDILLGVTGSASFQTLCMTAIELEHYVGKSEILRVFVSGAFGTILPLEGYILDTGKIFAEYDVAMEAEEKSSLDLQAQQNRNPGTFEEAFPHLTAILSEEDGAKGAPATP